MNFFELAGLLETTDLRSQLQMEKLTKSAEGSYLTFFISFLFFFLFFSRYAVLKDLPQLELQFLIFSYLGGRYYTKVAFAFLTQQPRVEISAMTFLFTA